MPNERVSKNGPDTDTKVFRQTTNTAIDELREQYSWMRKKIKGNGEPGLEETVRNNTKDIATLMDEIRTFHKWLRKIILGVLGWGAATGGLVVLGVIIWAIRQGALD